MNRKTLTISVVLAAFFLSLSLLLAFFAGLFPRFYSLQTFISDPSKIPCGPAMSLSGNPVLNKASTARCEIITATAGYANLLSNWTIKELLESFLCIGLLCLVFPILKAPRFLKRKLTLPRPVRYTLGLIAIGGLLYFLREEYLNVLYIETQSPSVLAQFYYLGTNSSAYAVVGLGVATLCVGLLAIGRGLSTGLKSAVLFGSFWVLVAQTYIYHFDYTEMSLQVTTVVKNWVIFGSPVLSNWFCLFMATSLFVLSASAVIGGKLKR